MILVGLMMMIGNAKKIDSRDIYTGKLMFGNWLNMGLRYKSRVKYKFYVY